MVTSIGFRNASNDLFVPANIPRSIPNINDIINPRIPRIMVAPTMNKKFLEISKLMVVTKVDSGEGKIKSELYKTDATFHKHNRNKTEMDDIMFVLDKNFLIKSSMLADRKLRINYD
jgi:hypothetical protein